MQFDFTSTTPAGIPVYLDRIYRVFAGGVAAVGGVDLNVAPGEFVAILGVRVIFPDRLTFLLG